MKQARTLFRMCRVNGIVDENRVRRVVEALVAYRPRQLIPILMAFKSLLSVEFERHTVQVESAKQLLDDGASVFAEVEKQFGPSLVKKYKINPDLIGGLRIQRGSIVWDGSVAQKLESLKTNIH